MEEIIERLLEWKREIEEDPELPKDVKWTKSTDIDLVIGRLRLCEEHEIYPKSIVIPLPTQLVRSGSSDYRIMEDCETEDRQSWKEAKHRGKPIRANEGDLLIKP